MPIKPHLGIVSDIFGEKRGATGAFFITIIIGEPMTTDDNDHPKSLVAMTMTDDDSDDDNNEASPTTAVAS